MASKPYGMTKNMWWSWLGACEDAGLNPPVIVQTIGNAKASAGYHALDGRFDGENYCCAVDASVKGFFGIGGLKEKQIKWLLYNLARHGYVGWYRYRKPFTTNRHLHIVYVGHRMKPQLQRQVFDFLNDRDGLASHKREVFWTAPPAVDAELKKKFLQHNPECASWFK